MAPPPSRTGPVDRIRVVTLVDTLSGNAGAEHFALLIATRLDPERFQSTFCVSRWPPPPEEANTPGNALERLQDAGVRFLPLGRSGKTDVWVWGKLERYLRRERIDILHAHKFGSNVWGAMIAALARVPVFLAHEHTWSYEGQPLRRFLDRELVARVATRFIAVSREDQRRMVDVERIDPARTLFVPIGIPPFPPAGGRDVRSEFGIAPGVAVIGVVGFLRAQKAHEVLLRAVAQLVGRWPAMQVLIVGDGPEQANLERLVGELELQDTVRFLGLRPDVPDVLRALDVAVCCSSFEGTPAAVLEYMDAALPIVATAVGGIPDLIDSGVHGLLVEPGDPGALAGALAELLADPQRASEMGARARERRRSEFDLDVMVGRFEALYSDLVEARRDARRGPSGQSNMAPSA